MKSESTRRRVCVCGASDFEFRIQAGSEGTLDIARCRVCGHESQRNLSDEDHDEFHQQRLQSSQLKIESIGAEHARMAEPDTLRRVNYVKSRGRSDCKVLDWGGAGEFMRAIQPDVAEVVGTELDHERIEFVTDRLGLDMAHPSMVMEEYGAGYFDVITLFHVLEHFVTPAEQLEQILELLKDDGLLIVEIPNLNDWMLKISSEYTHFWYQYAHAQFFTPISLLALLDGVGLIGNVEFIQRYNFQNMFHWLWTGRPQVAEPNKVVHSRLTFSKIAYARMLQSLRATDTKIVSAVSGK